MRLTVRGDDGEPIEFDCPDTIASRWTSTSILEGETYPYLPFVEDVQVVSTSAPTAAPPASTSAATTRTR
jgi:hypothetical protein